MIFPFISVSTFAEAHSSTADSIVGQRFEEEVALKEARRREQKEAHLYMMARVITDQTFRSYGGTDLCVFDANPELDPAAPRQYRLRRSMTMEEFTKQVAADIGQDPRRLRFWLLVNRQNKTIRPDQPIMDLRPTVEEAWARSSTQRENSLRVWAEVADEVNDEGEAVWPSFQGQANGAGIKNESIMLLLKHFDSQKQTLNGVGHVYLGKDKKIEDIVPHILKKMGWGDKLPAEEKLLLWEVGNTTYSLSAVDVLTQIGNQTHHDRAFEAEAIVEGG